MKKMKPIMLIIMYSPSQVSRGADNSLEPCAPEARAAGCDATKPNATTPHWPLCCMKPAPRGWGAEFS